MAYLSAFGRYVPPRIVSNMEMAAVAGCTPEWIRQVSGIEERRMAAPEVTTADMGVLAAQDCLRRAPRADIGLVIVSSGSTERAFPGPASAVALALGLAGVPAIDLPLPSAGALFGIALADQLAGRYGDVLVVASEKMSTIALHRPVNADVAVLFGDGAGACLVSNAGGIARIVDTVLHSDGSFAEDLRLGAEGALVMNGRTVIMQASRKIPQAIRELLDRHSIAPGDVDVFLLHQANQHLMCQVARALGVPDDRCFSNIRRLGNTSSASVLIATAEWLENRRFRSGGSVVLAAFGAGLHWGSLLAVGCEVGA